MQADLQFQTDVLIIGSGAAGLTLALKIADYYQVTVLSKDKLRSGSTWYAQGGIAAVFDEKDSTFAHIEDTLVAGANLCEQQAVELTVNQAKPCLEWLIAQGVEFDKAEKIIGTGGYHLTQEGGHSHRRILHAADATGSAVHAILLEKVQQHANIQILERCTAVDLITHERLKLPKPKCYGAYIWNRDLEIVQTVYAKTVVLATGGASRVYLYSSNPDVASGDGIAMAWRAGCRVTNLEFNQFHPTSLYHPQAANFLISEALRGEGAVLKRPDGSRFMDEFDSRGELASRDIVARAIDFEMKRLGVRHLWLDISHRSAEFITQHFPTIYQKCLSLGIDITQEAIPIVPAAHYTCGGVHTDLRGRTDLPHLFAIGEVAYTGLHGANRMASNSLLECIVFAEAASGAIIDEITTQQQRTIPQLPLWDESRVEQADEAVIIAHSWQELRSLMWDYVGIVRSKKRLFKAKKRLDLLQSEVNEYYSHYHVSHNLIELRNLVQVAVLIVESALSRNESRGLHYMKDFPETLAIAKPTILLPKNAM